MENKLENILKLSKDIKDTILDALKLKVEQIESVMEIISGDASKVSTIETNKSRTIKLGTKISKVKHISQYDLKGKLVGKYNSIYVASDQTGILTTSIMNVIAGRTKTAGGYRWVDNTSKESIETTIYSGWKWKEIITDILSKSKEPLNTDEICKLAKPSNKVKTRKEAIKSISSVLSDMTYKQEVTRMKGTNGRFIYTLLNSTKNERAIR